MKQLNNLLKELDEHLPKIHLQKHSVSTGSVGWHLEHSLLVIIQVITLMKESDPNKYKWTFHFWRTYIFFLGRIPRGKVSAPSMVQPKENSNQQKVALRLKVAKVLVEELALLDPKQFIKHPFLGVLSRKHIIKFLIIHTNHHLKIIKEIEGRG